jgi:uncharacterized protein YqgC (DUF456 family)
VRIVGIVVAVTLVLAAGAFAYRNGRRAGRSHLSSLLFALLFMSIIQLPVIALIWWGRRAGQRAARAADEPARQPRQGL